MSIYQTVSGSFVLPCTGALLGGGDTYLSPITSSIGYNLTSSSPQGWETGGTLQGGHTRGYEPHLVTARPQADSGSSQTRRGTCEKAFWVLCLKTLSALCQFLFCCVCLHRRTEQMRVDVSEVGHRRWTLRRFCSNLREESCTSITHL